MLMPRQQNVIRGSIIRFGYVADYGHVGAANGLVSLVEIHAQPTLALVDQCLRFKCHGSSLYRDGLSWRSSNAHESFSVLRGQLDLHGKNDGSIGRKSCDPLLPEHEQVVAAIDSRYEESGGSA